MSAAGDGSLGDLLRAARRRAGLTQEEAAARAGLSVAGLRDIEQGRVAAPRRQTLRRLGVALGLSVPEAEELAHRRAVGGGPTDPVWIGVLGPLTVRVDGVAMDPGSEPQRVLLGLLALSPNVPVGRERLLARVAAAGRPATVAGLAARMSRLRRRLRPRLSMAGGPSLVGSEGGYGLVVAEDQLDLLRFRALVRHARRQAALGELTQAWDLYARAVALWRGEPLAGLAPLADDPAVVGLARQWPPVAAEFAAVGAELGRHDEVVPVLRRVIAVDPLHEVAHARLMVALAGIGRQAEALEVFDRLRRRLIRDLDTAPGPELVEAHRRVLRQEVTRLSTAAPRARQALPADIADFTGREAELRWLRDRVDQPPAAAGAGPTILAIEGMAGAGKTRLAVHFAHQLHAEGGYPDQQLYADLAGYADTAPADPAAVLASFLHAMGLPPGQVPADLPGRILLYRRRLAGTRTLVLLDNAATAAQLAPLLPAGPESLCLVTSRRSLRLPGAHRLELDVFPPGEATALLAAALGPDRAGADPTMARRVVDACGRLPLAVGLVARRLQARPSWTLADAAARLSDPRRRLGELVAGGRSVRAAFDHSYRALPAGVRQHLRLLAGHAGAELTVASAVARLNTSPAGARRTLDHLRDEHLVAASGGNRYRLHELVRDYLREAG